MPYSTGMRLATKTQVVQAIPPANYTGAAATGTYVTTKNASHVTILIQTGAWAGGTAAVTVNQAQDVSATLAKALGITALYTDAASVGNGLIATAIVSNTFNLGVANATYLLEIDSTDLDLLNAFDCISLAVATPGSNADYYSATYILDGAVSYSGNTPPLATAN